MLVGMNRGLGEIQALSFFPSCCAVLCFQAPDATPPLLAHALLASLWPERCEDGPIRPQSEIAVDAIDILADQRVVPVTGHAPWRVGCGARWPKLLRQAAQQVRLYQQARALRNQR